VSTNPKTFLTPEQYLAIERKAEYKSEYYNGEMFAMAGAKEAHNLLVTTLVGLLYSQLRRGPCRVYSNDMRVSVSATGLYTYPDVVAVRGERQFLDEQRDTLLNPTLIIEVLSPSTEAYDRGRKFEHYQSIRVVHRIPSGFVRPRPRRPVHAAPRWPLAAYIRRSPRRLARPAIDRVPALTCRPVRERGTGLKIGDHLRGTTIRAGGAGLESVVLFVLDKVRVPFGEASSVLQLADLSFSFLSLPVRLPMKPQRGLELIAWACRQSGNTQISSRASEQSRSLRRDQEADGGLERMVLASHIRGSDPAPIRVKR